MDPTEEIVFYITTWYPVIGAGNTRTLIEGLSTPSTVMRKAAHEMLNAKPSAAFPDRHKEHIAYALSMVASGRFLSPPSAVASVYLATRFEFYFRVLSGRLNADGAWRTPKDKEEMRNLFPAERRLKNDRINSVALAYKIMKTNHSFSLARICDDLDRSLYATRIQKMPTCKTLDMGSRIEYARHRSAHGHWGDISAEAEFYGLLTALVFYNQGGTLWGNKDS